MRVVAFALLLSLISSSAHASSEEPIQINLEDVGLSVASVTDDQTIDLNHIVVLGKGVQDEETNDVAVLLCAGKSRDATGAPTCENIRIGVFNDRDKTARYFGPSYYVGEQVGHDQDQRIKEVLKMIASKFKKFEKDKHATTNLAIYTLTTFAGVFVGGHYTVKMNNGVPLYIAAALCAITWILGMKGFLFPNLFGTSSGLIRMSLNSQDGWNWINHPNRISSSKFYDFLLIASGEPIY